MSSSRARSVPSLLLSLILVVGSLLSFSAQAQTHRLQSKPQSKTSGKRNLAKAQTRRPNDVIAALRKSVRLQTPRIEEEEEENSKFKEDPAGRRNWFWSERAYPFDEIPVEGRRAAWEAIASEVNAHQFAAEAVIPTWRAIGPRPTNSYFPNNWGRTSGRINSIAVSPADPRIVLVGASTGGVWRSTDGGETFEPVSDNHVDLAVGHIAFAKSNPNIVYAGMGDLDNGYMGTGVLKSTDAGKTWQRVNNNTLPALGYLVRLEVDPTDPNRVYVAQYLSRSSGSVFVGGFFYSTDGGINWKRTLPGTPTDLVISPANAKTIYVGMDSLVPNVPAGVYRSTDGGDTWSVVYASPFPLGTEDVRVAVTSAAPNNLYIYTGGGNAQGFLEIRLATSKDSGATWESKIITSQVDQFQFGYNTYLAVDPQNANTIYAGTRDVFKSTDGGNTWVNQNNNFNLRNQYNPFVSNAHPDQHTLAFIPGQANAFFIGNDGGLYKTTDGGRTYTSRNQTLSLSQIVGMDISPFDPTLTLIGTQDNGTQLRFPDGNWYEISTGDGGATVFSPRNPNVFFTSYVYGSITRFDLGAGVASTVGSQRIFGDFSAGTPRINFYPPIKGTTDGRLYFGSWRLFLSRNNGTTWYTPGWAVDLTRSPSDRINAIGVSNVNSDVIYTGSSAGRVMVTRDSGESWTDITAGLPNRVIKSITTNPTNPAMAYLTVSGYASPHVFKTTNYGATWQNISGNLPDIPTSAFTFDPLTPGVIYAGTDIGVFRSTNDGRTWEPFLQGMPPVIVTALVAHPSGILQAATYGRGVYELNLKATSATDNLTPETIK